MALEATIELVVVPNALYESCLFIISAVAFCLMFLSFMLLYEDDAIPPPPPVVTRFAMFALILLGDLKSRTCCGYSIICKFKFKASWN